MNIHEAIQWGKTELQNISTPSLDTELLLAFVLNTSREFLFVHEKTDLSTSEFKTFTTHIAKRKTHYPLAYILEKKEFFGREFFVSEDCLIPRPETEELIELARNEIQKHQSKILIDIGTGSGCIAITLAKIFPSLQILATDISEKTLQIAKKNAKTLEVSIEFILSDLLSNISSPIDIVLANLPYVPASSPLSKEVQQEPALALFGGNDGLTLYKKLWEQMIQKNISNGIFEIDRTHTHKIPLILEQYLHFFSYEILQDITGHTRFLRLRSSMKNR